MSDAPYKKRALNAPPTTLSCRVASIVFVLPGVPQKQAAFCAERGPPLSHGQKEVFLHKRQEQDNSYPSAGDRVGKAEAGASGQTVRSVPVQVSPASRRGKSAAAFPANTAAGLRKSALQVCSPGFSTALIETRNCIIRQPTTTSRSRHFSSITVTAKIPACVPRPTSGNVLWSGWNWRPTKAAVVHPSVTGNSLAARAKGTDRQTAEAGAGQTVGGRERWIDPEKLREYKQGPVV